jgi:Ni2+-binding GTPase involved in maturation of urease and hydrogenase
MRLQKGAVVDMQAAGFAVHCPYELGDRVEVAIIEGMAITGYPRKAGTALMEITDILTIHSLKKNTVTFLYELDGKKKMQLIPWEELARR